ncbi:MAG: S-layer homology domain-containing protein [Clostridiales bacterium]|nr:S-layer homology domain-containing protein [Clostridiales bacterium]
MKIRNVLMTAVMAFSIVGTVFVAVGLDRDEVRAAVDVPMEIELDKFYDLDFSKDEFGATYRYKVTYTAGDSTDYVLTTYGTHKLIVHSYIKESSGSSSIEPLSKAATDEFNYTRIYKMTKGETYIFYISRQIDDWDDYDFSGENDVKILLKKYQDTSPVIANFDQADFPDKTFRDLMIDKADYFKDGKLTQYEADKITYLDVSSKEISDLKGIEYFGKINHLSCSSNKLTSLDLTGNKELETFSCSYNQIGSLDLSGNPKLTRCYCYDNNIVSIDLKNNSNLTNLDCGKNKLSKLDLCSCPLLTYLDAGYNQDLSDLNISGLSQITNLRLNDCALTSLNVSGLKLLRYLSISNYLNTSNNKIKDLDVSFNPCLESLYCERNGMEKLKVSGCSALESLDCSDNLLKSLDLSGDVNLDCLYTNNNQLTMLDVSGSPNLSYVYYKGTKSYSNGAVPYYSYEYTNSSAYPKIELYLNFDENVTVTAKDPGDDPGIPIDENTFPDPVFMQYVKDEIDRSGDGYLSEHEIFNAREISMFGSGVKDLTGVKIFTSLTNISLSAEKNIKSLDVSGLKNLTELNLSWSFEKINIKGCTALQKLYVDGNDDLESIDLSDCPNLVSLEVNNCRLIKSLDLSHCPKLRRLKAHIMYALEKLDISDCPDLVRAYLEGHPGTDSRYDEYIISSGTCELSADHDLEIIYEKPKPTPTATATPTATPTATATPKAGTTVTAAPTSGAKPSAKPSGKPSSAPTKASAVTLTLDKKTAALICGKNLTLKATLKGSSAKVSWKSSDPKILAVDASGKVTAKMAGTVTVTATASGKSAKCVITVLYKDVTNSKDFWYKPTNYLTASGIVKGYDKQTLFKPTNDCTRAQMVTFLYRLQGEPKTKATTCKFKDVKKSDYFYKPVIWASEKGITTGVSKDKFDPQRVCTRAQTVTFLWRMADKPKPKTTKNPFPDVKKSDYFYTATIWASEKKILAGLPDGTFNPQGKCLRRQMVTFLYKYDKFVNGKG